MATRIGRLSRQKDFALIKQRGSTGNARYLTVRGGAASEPLARVAVIVSQRVSKKAVDRNLIRRRIRSALRELPTGALTTRDILIIARPGCQAITYQALHEDLRRALVRARLLKHNL